MKKLSLKNLIKKKKKFLKRMGQEEEFQNFEKTLSNLSRQLEIDRLAFLHQSMKDRGEKVPTSSQIAADIKGTKPLAPKGDNDEYGSRPTARLDGWVSGLSFGVSRRAKKFSK